jgi:hypothetical protein
MGIGAARTLITDKPHCIPMSQNTNRKILLSIGETIYSFLTYQLEDADGSFYIFIQRGGRNHEHLQFSSNDPRVLRLPLEHGRGRRKKISYHSSGCVRYHNTDFSAKYFEPLLCLTRPNAIGSFVVPSVSRLDILDGLPTDDDFVLEVTEYSEPIEFHFLIAPWDFHIASHHVAVRYEGLFAFILELSHPTIAIPQEAMGHFIFAVPEQGVFEQQAIDKHNALISFHQRLNKARDLILYSPNKEGVYKIICAVPMRIPPQAEITFLDSQYSAEVIQATESVVKFHVKNQHGHTVKQEVPITSVALHAEL